MVQNSFGVRYIDGAGVVGYTTVKAANEFHARDIIRERFDVAAFDIISVDELAHPWM